MFKGKVDLITKIGVYFQSNKNDNILHIIDQIKSKRNFNACPSNYINVKNTLPKKYWPKNINQKQKHGYDN